MKAFVEPEPLKGKARQTFRIVTNVRITDEGRSATLIEQGLPHSDAVQIAREHNRKDHEPG